MYIECYIKTKKDNILKLELFTCVDKNSNQENNSQFSQKSFFQHTKLTDDKKKCKLKFLYPQN